MKKLLLLLSLLLATNAWGEEDEFPMKLTCELGSNILYVYIAEDIDNSWFQLHQSSGLHVEKYGTTKIFVHCPRGRCYVEKNKISLFRRNLTRPALELNRLTNKANGLWGSGHCFKGFKEYK